MDMTEVNVPGAARLKERLSKSRNKGLTLIEAAMVLAIMALVVAGIMLFYTNANTSRLTTKVLNDLSSIQQSVRTVFGGQSTYTGLSNTVVIDSQALPTSMISGTTIRHAFNGDVTIAPATVNGTANAGFTVSFANIPGEACSKMGAQDLGRGLVALTINSTSITLPPSVATVTSACTDRNTMVWTFQ